MFGRLVDWIRDQVEDHRAIWSELGRLEAEIKPPVPAVQASITYYGTLGEMGHPDDRTYGDDW